MGELQVLSGFPRHPSTRHRMTCSDFGGECEPPEYVNENKGKRDRERRPDTRMCGTGLITASGQADSSALSIPFKKECEATSQGLEKRIYLQSLKFH